MLNFSAGILFLLLLFEYITTQAQDIDPVLNVSAPIEEEPTISYYDNTTTLIDSSCSFANGTLDCSDRGISDPFLEADWNGVKDLNLSEVNLSKNPLTSITKIAILPIRILNVSHCSIEHIENLWLTNLKDLETLDLSYNEIATSSLSRRTFEGAMVPNKGPQVFRNLQNFSLSHNDIHSLPQDIFFFMTELIALDLSGNPLVFIDQVTMAAISDLTKLRELKLSGCELETLPEGLLRRQRNIKHLDLSDNRLTTVPSTLAEATCLRYLSLDKNPFTEIKEGTAISNLTKLRELHLSRLSKLTRIGTGALTGLANLQTLVLSYNPRLTTLDPGFLMWQDEDDMDTYPPLKAIYLNNNNISEVNSQILDRWDQLTVMEFTSNPYYCGCRNQWMVDVLVPLMTAAGQNSADMFCKSPAEVRGLSFSQLREQSRTLACTDNEDYKTAPATADMAIILGIMIGIFVSFPLTLVVILMWRRGYFARCRGRRRCNYYYDEHEENDAF